MISTRTKSRVISLTTLLLIILLSVLLAWISTRYEWHMDWTRSGRHSLSDASREMLSRMQEPIQITVYAREDTGVRESIRQFVERYQRVKNDISLTFVNPDVVPDEVRELGISTINEMVIYYGNNSQHIQPGSEEEMTNALQRLARKTEHWLAFSEGHGERSPLGEANFDYGDWGQQLKHRGFRIQPVNLSEIKAIPDNTRVLILADPRVDFLPGEINLLREYIDAGGNLLWMIEPPGDLHNLAAIADTLQVSIQPGMVIDSAGRLIGLDDPSIVLETTSLYPDHPVTSDFHYTTLFPTATAITAGDNSIWNSRPLIVTGDHTWLETGEISGEVSYDEGADQAGPLDIAISLEREVNTNENGQEKARSQRIVILGDSDFLANTYIANSGNLDLGMRIMNWLSQDEDFISIPAAVAADASLELTPVSAALIGFGFLLVLPLLMIAAGFIQWWRRRKR